jgi:2-oxoglutarate dehydrogenase E2 component (dihydrolipoamide succinyltransferase)
MKNVGDRVERDEALYEISTDKVDSEMPSPSAGVLLEILVPEGDTVLVGGRVAVIGEGDASAPAAKTAAPTPEAASEASASTVSTSPTPAPASAPEAVVPTAAPVPARQVASDGEAGVVTSPVVRRILADGGVEPAAIRGTGPGGAITRRDAERAVANGPTDELLVPLSNGRKRMGEHMVASSQTTPQGFVVVEVDASVVDRLDIVGRETRDGAYLSDEMLVALSAVRALGEFPFLNATYADDELVVHRTINLGLVRTQKDDGMLVPVVHAAAGLTLRALARRVADLDERLATRQLTTDDLMGGTFTILGSPNEQTLWTQPIIIQPQVAVLSAGAARLVPVVERVDGTTSIVLGRRMLLGLTFDHRICEPTIAANYLQRVGELLAGFDVEGER